MGRDGGSRLQLGRRRRWRRRRAACEPVLREAGRVCERVARLRLWGRGDMPCSQRPRCPARTRGHEWKCHGLRCWVCRSDLRAVPESEEFASCGLQVHWQRRQRLGLRHGLAVLQWLLFVLWNVWGLRHGPGCWRCLSRVSLRCWPDMHFGGTMCRAARCWRDLQRDGRMRPRVLVRGWQVRGECRRRPAMRERRNEAWLCARLLLWCLQRVHRAEVRRTRRGLRFGGRRLRLLQGRVLQVSDIGRHERHVRCVRQGWRSLRCRRLVPVAGAVCVRLVQAGQPLDLQVTVRR